MIKKAILNSDGFVVGITVVDDNATKKLLASLTPDGCKMVNAGENAGVGARYVRSKFHLPKLNPTVASVDEQANKRLEAITPDDDTLSRMMMVSAQYATSLEEDVPTRARALIEEMNALNKQTMAILDAADNLKALDAIPVDYKHNKHWP